MGLQVEKVPATRERPPRSLTAWFLVALRQAARGRCPVDAIQSQLHVGDIMKIVPRGTTVARDEQIAGRQVTKEVVTLNKAEKTTYQDTWKLNFEGVSDEELIRLATRSLVIELQQKFRDSKAADVKKWDSLSLSVREHLDGKRKRLTSEEKKSRAMEAVKTAGVSADDLRKMLEEMEGDEE